MQHLAGPRLNHLITDRLFGEYAEPLNYSGDTGMALTLAEHWLANGPEHTRKFYLSQWSTETAESGTSARVTLVDESRSLRYEGHGESIALAICQAWMAANGMETE